MATRKEEVIRSLTFGHRIAEDEREALAGYFVETDQWNQVVNGTVDVVYGSKGSGKSAIFTSLMNRENQFFDEGILLTSAERPQGATVFQDLVNDPPTSEMEFVVLWKLYILSLLGASMRRYNFMSGQADRVHDALVSEGLFQPDSVNLSTRFRSVVGWLRRVIQQGIKEVSGDLKFDALTGMPTGLGASITLGEPTSEERRLGGESVDNLLELANEAFDLEGYNSWILFDRLDVAFAQSRELETNALRALFKAYLDCASLHRIRLKVFLRTENAHDQLDRTSALETSGQPRSA